MLVAVVAVSALVDKHYTGSWAVEVEGGSAVADELARRHGLSNRGKVGNLKNMYHFELLREVNEVMQETTDALKREAMVKFVQQQHYTKMSPKLPH